MKAIWNDHVVAESDNTEVVEDNHYFPPGAINWNFLEESDRTYHCPWKGDASYYHLVADDERADAAAWSYPEPKDAARQIKDHVAFYDDRVEITE